MNEQMKHYANKLQYEMDPSDLFEALKKGEKIIVVDTRKPTAFEAEHIRGSINIPHREMNKEQTQKLDRNVLYITYCDGIGCNASTKGALNMAKLGFNVKELIGGLEWWKKDGYETNGTQCESNGSKVECSC
jgi:rhodanese-related sulfurtransferase